MVLLTVLVPSAAMVVTVLTVRSTPSMSSVAVCVVTVLTCSLPSAKSWVVFSTVTFTPFTSWVWVSFVVETTSRTASMLWVTFFVPSAAVVVMVFTSERTPFTIWRLVSVTVCFCCWVPFFSVSLTVSVVRVTPFSTWVLVAVMEFTTSEAALLAAELDFFAAFWVAVAADSAALEISAAEVFAAAASS